MNIIITGADGALGTAVVSRFVQSGHKVAALCGTIADDVISQGRFVAGNLADQANAGEVIGRAAEWLGSVDALVHLVGSFRWVEVQDTQADDWHAMYVSNVGTAVAAVNSVSPHLVDEGAILLVGAKSAQPAGAGFGPYGAAKAGVARLSEALSAELSPRRIRVNAILPAIIDTPRNRLDMPDADFSGWTTPDAIADTIVFLASPASRAITGALIPVSNNA